MPVPLGAHDELEMNAFARPSMHAAWQTIGGECTTSYFRQG
jgi:hypothetical protein